MQDLPDNIAFTSAVTCGVSYQRTPVIDIANDVAVLVPALNRIAFVVLLLSLERSDKLSIVEPDTTVRLACSDATNNLITF